MKKATANRNHPDIDRFIDSLWSQKGLADLTLSAYQQDLLLFASAKAFCRGPVQYPAISGGTFYRGRVRTF